MRFALLSELSLKHEAGPETESFRDVYVGDILSRAMNRIKPDVLWITVVGHINTVAVASLSRTAAIILADGALLDENARRAADREGISVYSSGLDVFTLCRRIARIADTAGDRQ